MSYFGIIEYSKKCVQEAAEQRKSTNIENFLEIKNFVDKQFTALVRLNMDIALYVSKYMLNGKNMK
ncbi:22744_t:CDS:2 [Racocetra persica]|uniref:22744_t:CDS:1 n=1 Tax=Racocetra persica TaxID=160502 RepID=A0ACA9M851_9GLOM|nr:22744_t:CDS:2 [Racocetra persica]